MDDAQQRATEFVPELYAAGQIDAHVHTGWGRVTIIVPRAAVQLRRRAGAR